MYSDLYALSFYKVEFAREKFANYHRMEIIDVYNIFIERKFCHFFYEKSWFAISAKEIYDQIYDKEMQRRKVEVERAAEIETYKMALFREERR
jgi:hypothetical protein